MKNGIRQLWRLPDIGGVRRSMPGGGSGAISGVGAAVAAALLASGAGSAFTPGAVTPSLIASAISGPAPLAVHFDSTATTAAGVSDPFRQLGYYFDYDDPGSGEWGTSGLSKNVDTGGPLGAHLFETPGTYEILVGVYNPATSDFAQIGVTVTVTDPNTVFSGTNTICLSRNTDHTGAPAGAQLISNVTSWPAWASNRRYLLRAGQDFTSMGTLSPAGSSTRTNVQVGKYGSGANPIVDDIATVSFIPSSTTSYPTNITIMDLESKTAVSNVTSTGLALLRITGLGGSADGVAIAIADGIFYDYDHADPVTVANLHWPINTFIIECEFAGGAGSAQYGATGSGRNLVVMGCTFADPDQHSIRIWLAYKLLIQHNAFGHAPDGHQVKFHSAGSDAWNDLLSIAYDVASSLSILRNNTIGPDSDSLQPFAVGPGDAGRILGLEDILVENNNFEFDAVADIELGGRRLTERGNTGVPLSVSTSYNDGDIPPGWDGPYYTGGAAIATQAPVR